MEYNNFYCVINVNNIVKLLKNSLVTQTAHCWFYEVSMLCYSESKFDGFRVTLVTVWPLLQMTTYLLSSSLANSSFHIHLGRHLLFLLSNHISHIFLVKTSVASLLDVQWCRFIHCWISLLVKKPLIVCQSSVTGVVVSGM